MHAVAQVLQDVALKQVAVGGINVDAVASLAYVVADPPGTVYCVQVNAVTPVLGAQPGIALDAVVAQADIPRPIDPDPEALALKAVATNHRPLGDRPAEHRSIHRRRVMPPIQESQEPDLTGGG